MRYHIQNKIYHVELLRQNKNPKNWKKILNCSQKNISAFWKTAIVPALPTMPWAICPSRELK